MPRCQFDTGNILRKSMEHVLHFFVKIMKLRHLSESPQIPGNLTWNLSYKKSLKFMSANADSVRFKLVCNVHCLGLFKKIAFSGKT